MSETGPLDLVLYAILLFPLLLIVFDSACRLLFLIVIHLPEARTDARNDESGNLRLLLLVVAHNEQETIEQTLALIKAQTDADDASRVAVLADHCTDETASIATRMGARVCSRDEGCQGKSQALAWFADHSEDLLSSADAVTVLDADTLVDAGFTQGMRAAFRPGVQVVQARVNPLSKNGFPVTTLVSFSEILSGKIDDAARSRLHWSVPLRGTGMAFRTPTFMRACRELGTQVDDIELSVRLAELGIAVRLAPHAAVNDPKSDHMLGLARQRGRWLKGQRQIWKTKGANILRLLNSGLPNWSLIQALLLKPKTALVAMRLVMLALLWAGPFQDTPLHTLMLGTVLGSLMVDMLYYVTGLRFTGNAGRYLISLLTSPILLALWGISWVYSLLPTPEWLRTQDR